MKYTCISTSGSISAQGPQDQLPRIKLTGNWDQMACNGSSNPSKPQRRGKDPPCLSLSESESSWKWKTCSVFRDSETVLCLRRRAEGGGKGGGQCYFCTARRWWWPVCVLVGKRKGEVKGKEGERQISSLFFWQNWKGRSHRWHQHRSQRLESNDRSHVTSWYVWQIRDPSLSLV